MSFYLLQQPNQGLSTILLFGGMFIVMYFFMIRPQQNKQKEHKKLIDNLKKGDKIVSSSGIHGTIVTVNEQTVGVEVDSKGTKIVMDKVAILRTVSSAE